MVLLSLPVTKISEYRLNKGETIVKKDLKTCPNIINNHASDKHARRQRNARRRMNNGKQEKEVKHSGETY
jgi:hypothetical protein